MKRRIKKFFSIFFKLFLVIFILALFGGVIALSIGYYIKAKDLKDLRNTYKTAEQNLNQNKQENEVTVKNLQDSFNSLNTENTNLKTENQDLKDEIEKTKAMGYAEIQGEILPFIVEDQGFNQYQNVCAENTSNTNLRYCVTTPASKKKYILVVPSGEYHVYATIDSSNENLRGYKAYYTEYVKCIEEKDVSQCDENALSTPITVKVEAGKTITGVNPTSWKKI